MICVFFAYPTFSADIQDSFVQDLELMQDTFGEDATRANSLKKQIQDKECDKKKDKDKKKNKNKKDENSEVSASVTNIDIISDKIDYYPERQEIEAIGHASIILTDDGAELRADKLVFNQNTGILIGTGDVRLIKDKNIMEGDYIKVNMNEKNAFLDKPYSENLYLTLKAENANVLANKDILMENGVINLKGDELITFGTGNFGAYGQKQLSEAKKSFYVKQAYNDEYKIKAKEIIVDSRKEHDVISARNVDIYLKDMKLNSAGNLKLVTNKEQQFVETNIPEIGFIKQMGMYVGPGFAMEAPLGGALKVAPFFNVFRNKVGVGALARYRNEYNVTEFAISTNDESETILRGELDITDDLKLQYGMNGYLSEWWLGDRVSGKMAELVYQKENYLDDIGVNFQHRLSGGIVEDFNRDYSTMRFRWMTQSDKSIWFHGDDVRDFYSSLDLSAQTAFTAYGTGDTFGLLRIGPRLRTETSRWVQTLGYYFAAVHGDSPFFFDKYMYGRSNLYLSEGLKLNKYLSVMWMGSLALNEDAFDGKFMQENRFFVMMGPDDMKFVLGYDTVRERTFFNCELAFGTKNTITEFEKLRIKNPDKLGKSEKQEKIRKKKKQQEQQVSEDGDIVEVKDKKSLKDKLVDTVIPSEEEYDIEERKRIISPSLKDPTEIDIKSDKAKIKGRKKPAILIEQRKVKKGNE